MNKKAHARRQAQITIERTVRWPLHWLVTIPWSMSYLAVVDDYGNLVEVRG